MSSAVTAPYRAVTTASGPASAIIAALTGSRATADSRFATDMSVLTLSIWPAAACRLIRGMIAVSRETPRIPYGQLEQHRGVVVQPQEALVGAARRSGW